MAHPWHDVALPEIDRLGTSFPAVIEISEGSKNKYELDPVTGLLRVDRVLFSAVHYPANYGFVPRTLGEDGDPVDVLVLSQGPIVPLAICTVHAIGGFEMRDEHGIDTKIIAVHTNDPAVRDYRCMSELPPHVMLEIRRFFEDYKVLEGKEVAVGDDLSVEQAVDVLRKSALRYQEKFASRR